MIVLQHGMVSSCCHGLGIRFHYASSSEDHFSTDSHLEKREKQPSADPETAVFGVPWSTMQSCGEKRLKQIQPICNSIGCRAALNCSHSLPKLQQPLAGQGLLLFTGSAARVRWHCLDSVNCWADLKDSLTQRSSSLPALKHRNSVASKPQSKQMSQPSPPQRWKKPVTVITVTQAPTSSLQLLIQMPSDRQMFPARNTALSEPLVASPTRTALPQLSLARAVTCWSHSSSAGLSASL